MKFRIILGTAVAGAAMLVAAGGAFAGATETILGVTFPVGLVAGGNQIDSSILSETLVTAVGQHDIGVGIVNAIDNSLVQQIWGNGQNGVELAYTFDYIASSVTAPTSTVNGSLTFSSGTATFYVLPANTQVNGLGSVAQDVAAVQAGTLFLSTLAPKFDANGDVLVSTIPANTSLTAFAGGTGQGDLDVTGGPAGPFFKTGTFANAFDTTGFSDMSFTSDFSVGSSGDFALSGSDTVKANAVPEPLSLGVLGLGVAALGAIRRRKRTT